MQKLGFFPIHKEGRGSCGRKKGLFVVPGPVKVFLALKANWVHQPCHTFSEAICHL